MDRLKIDSGFRYTCDFNILELIPSRSTFSRFLMKLSRTNSLEKDFEALVIRDKKLRIIDGTNVSIDSTKIDAYEKSKLKPNLKNDDISANWGVKRDSDENKYVGLVINFMYWLVVIAIYH